MLITSRNTSFVDVDNVYEVLKLEGYPSNLRATKYINDLFRASLSRSYRAIYISFLFVDCFSTNKIYFIIRCS